MNFKRLRRIKRHKKIKLTIKNSDCPRLTVFKSNRYIYAQIIDNNKGNVITSVSEKELKQKGKKTENALELGKLLAQKAIAKKIKKVVFDRGGYRYHGRIKNLADGARNGGLIF